MSATADPLTALSAVFDTERLDFIRAVEEKGLALRQAEKIVRLSGGPADGLDVPVGPHFPDWLEHLADSGGRYLPVWPGYTTYLWRPVP